MKKLLLFAPLSLYISMAFTQINFGLKGGLNISKFYGTGPGSISGASTFTAGNVGIFFNQHLTKKSSLELELAASWEGEGFSYREIFSHSEGTCNYTYLNLPIIYRQNIFKGCFIETGPQFGLLLNSKITSFTDYYYQNGTQYITYHLDYNDHVSKLHWGWDFGLGYKLSKTFLLGLRYNMGLSQLGKSDTYNPNYKNKVFSFNLFFSPFRRHFHNKHI